MKWAKRHPAAAALAVMSGLAALAFGGLIVGLSYNARLQVALARSRNAAGRGRTAAVNAEALELNIRYERDVKLAQQAWQEAHIEQALGLARPLAADEHRPAGPARLGMVLPARPLPPGLPDPRGPAGAYGVRSLAFHPDSRRLATAGWEGTISVWDIVDGSLVKTLKGHAGLD